MRFAPLVLAPLLTLATPALAAGPGESLVAVELYTSQGCSGCFEASDFAAELAQRKDVLLLSFGVDYWDYLGWRDTSARPEFISRQRQYIGSVADNPNRHPYTPQMIVDGHFNGEALDRGLINLAIEYCMKGGHLAKSPTVALERDGDALTVSIGDGARQEKPGDVWLVAYEPGEHDVSIGAGENARKVFKTYNTVRDITRIGEWKGEPVTLTSPTEDGLGYAVLVQKPALGAMLATAALGSETPSGGRAGR